MGTGSFPGLSGRGVALNTLSTAEVKERVELYLYSPSGPSWPVLGRTLLLLYLYLGFVGCSPSFSAGKNEEANRVIIFLLFLSFLV